MGVCPACDAALIWRQNGLWCDRCHRKVEIRSEGLRHGDAAVMAALARGEPVAPDQYFFRTFVRFATGAPVWAYLNRVMAVASGARSADGVVLAFHRVG